MPDHITLIRTAIAVLRDRIAFHTHRNVPHAPAGQLDSRAQFMALVRLRLDRATTRLASLFARWRAGTLPSPREPRACAPRPNRPYPRLPTTHAWLLQASQDGADPSEAHGSLRLDVVTAGAALRRILAQPEMAEFLAAAPQAGRILRPLCRMLGIAAAPNLPAHLNLPAPPRLRLVAPKPIHRGIIDPPDVPQPFPPGSIVRIGPGWYR